MNKNQKKQATKGQRQIYEENKSTFNYYLAACLLTSFIIILVNILFFKPSTSWPWIGLFSASSIQICSLFMMFRMMKAVRNDKNQIIDAGLDLNDPAAFGEYCKDTLIVACVSQVLGLVSVYLYLSLLVIPFYAMYKLWKNILAPWFFEPPPSIDPNSEKESKKRRKDKFVNIRK